MTAITILRQPPIAGQGAAYGFVIGNIAGYRCHGRMSAGGFARVTCIPFACRVVVGLLFLLRLRRVVTWPILFCRVGDLSIVLGLGLAPLPGDSGTFFITRVFNVIVATIYTIGIASVLWAPSQGPRLQRFK